MQLWSKSFDKYQLGALTVEHNFLEPKRSEIKTLMENHGYKRVWTSDRDDFYLPAHDRSSRMPVSTARRPTATD